MQKIVTFLTYASRAEEAAELYVSLFKNSSIRSVTRYHTDLHGQTKGSVQTVSFVLDGQEFVALNGGPHFNFSEGISLSVMCDSQEEIDRYWEKLGEGGVEQACGWLKDKFGVSWQIQYSKIGDFMNQPEEGKRRRVMEAMGNMIKIDVAKLEEAVRG